uniref:Uncharacterized protein n=1 Tax=Arundo donax TaxID=35708 RepID=A0A0A8Y132_ARUDO
MSTIRNGAAGAGVPPLSTI